jgi:hypothetical protein
MIFKKNSTAGVILAIAGTILCKNRLPALSVAAMEA